MSLGIVFKGAEGIVLAADSRVTLETQKNIDPNTKFIMHSTYDNATKLLKVNGQNHIGAVTYGLAALGGNEPRTAHSFIPEFEAELMKTHNKRLSVQEFADEFSNFFMKQWGKLMSSNYQGAPMVFLIGGYDIDAPYGRVFEISIPDKPSPNELNPSSFGITFGGQTECVARILQGFDPNIKSVLKQKFSLDDNQANQLITDLSGQLAINIPYEFLPLQDCVDLCIFLIKATIQMQQLAIGIRGVGGAIDIAVITKTVGFQPVQEKVIGGESKKLM